MKRITPLLFALGVCVIFPSCATTDGDSDVTATSHETESSYQATQKAYKEVPNIVPYPFKTCAVQIHRRFKDGKPKHRRVYKGYEVLFCCDPCVKAFDMNPDPYMPRIMAAAGQ